MKLTKLSAAPTLAPESALARRRRLMPAPSQSHAGTASQLIPGVGRTMGGTTRRTTIRLVAGLAAVLLCQPAAAGADTGVPMIAMLWPGFWVLLLPIVFLEALVAKRVLRMDWLAALRISAEVNVVSTLVGIPLSWFGLLVVEMAALGLGGLVTQNPPTWLSYVLLPFMSPWLAPPSDEDMWVVPAAAAWLLCLLFFTTVWLEKRYVAWRTELPTADVRIWSWRANLLSYAILEVLLVGRLTWMLFVE
jgi:hypothetical protein